MYTANLSAEPANQNAYGSLCISMMSFWRFSNSADPGLAAGNAKQPVCRARHFLVWQLDPGTPSHCLSTVMAPDYFLDYLVAFVRVDFRRLPQLGCHVCPVILRK